MVGPSEVDKRDAADTICTADEEFEQQQYSMKLDQAVSLPMASHAGCTKLLCCKGMVNSDARPNDKQSIC